MTQFYYRYNNHTWCSIQEPIIKNYWIKIITLISISEKLKKYQKEVFLKSDTENNMYLLFENLNIGLLIKFNV